MIVNGHHFVTPGLIFIQNPYIASVHGNLEVGLGDLRFYINDFQVASDSYHISDYACCVWMVMNLLVRILGTLSYSVLEK